MSQLSLEMFLFNVITELHSLNAEINEILSAIMMIYQNQALYGGLGSTTFLKFSTVFHTNNNGKTDAN